MQDKPYPLEDDRSQEFQDSGAELLLAYGRSIYDTHHGCLSIEAMFEETEKSEEPRKEMYRRQSELFEFFREHQHLPLRRHLCSPGNGSQIDIRVSSILAYIAVCLVDSGQVCLPILAISSAVADVLPIKTPILEVRRIIAALVANGILACEEGSSKLNPSMRLGDPFVKDFYGKRCYPQLGETSAVCSPSDCSDDADANDDVPAEDAWRKKQTQELGEDASEETYE